MARQYLHATLLLVGMLALCVAQNTTTTSGTTAAPVAETTTAGPAAPVATTTTKAATTTTAQPIATTTATTTPTPDTVPLVTCYSCSNCIEPFNASHPSVKIATCRGKCEKNYRTANTASVTGTVVDRACDARAREVACPPPLTLFGWTTADCYCSTDYCNAGMKQGYTVALTGLPVILAAYKYFS